MFHVSVRAVVVMILAVVCDLFLYSSTGCARRLSFAAECTAWHDVTPNRDL